MKIPVISGFIELGQTWLRGRNQIKQAEVEAQLSNIKAESVTKVAIAQSKQKMAEEGQFQDYDLDRIATENMRYTWKDEILMLIIMAPIILTFLGYEERVKAGFDALGNMPDWYTWLVIGIFIVTFGMRGLLKLIINRGVSLNK